MKRLLIGVALAAAATMAGCPAAHDPYPSDECAASGDCFRGEACVAQRCVPAGSDRSDGGARD